MKVFLLVRRVILIFQLERELTIAFSTQLKKVSGGKATQASQINYQLAFDVNHELFSSTKIHYRGTVMQESYDVADQSLFRFGVGLGWNLIEKLHLQTGVSYNQRALIVEENNRLGIEFVSHPQWDLNFNHSIDLLWESQLLSSVDVAYLFSGSQGNVELNSGLSYQLQLGLAKELFGMSWSVNGWWKNSEIATNQSDQTTGAVGFGLWWHGSF